jgi:hypothetical protein
VAKAAQLWEAIGQRVGGGFLLWEQMVMITEAWLIA